MMIHNFILNEIGYGPVGEGMQAVNFDLGLLRPYMDGKHPTVTINGNQVFNEETNEFEYEQIEVRIKDLQDNGMDTGVWGIDNVSLMRKEDWIRLDTKVTMSTRQRMRAWNDLYAAAGTSYDGYSKLTHEYEAMSDPGEAIQSMDMMSFGRTDAPKFKLRSVPLVITHCDYWFSDRRIAVFKNSGMPLPTTMGEAAGRRVAEMVERNVIGTETGLEFGTQTTGITQHDGLSKIYGYTNAPSRNTKTNLTAPTGSNPEAVLADVLSMIETLNGDGFFGPFMLYHSTPYSIYLNNDYFRTGSTSAVRSLRDRLMEIDGLVDIRRLDFLTSGYQLILVQMDPEWVEAINGMEVQTFMSEDMVGARKNFRVACIHVPLIKFDYNGNSPIVHGTTS